MQVGYLEPKAGEPEHEPGEGRWIGQLDAKRGCPIPYRDLAVIELRAQRLARLTGKSDLIGERLHRSRPAVRAEWKLARPYLLGR